MVKKIFRQMLLTQILSALTVTICMLVDSIMIGRFLGSDALAAYGLANPILLIFAAIGNMMSSGIQVMCSKALGAGDKKESDTAYTIGITVTLAISIIGVIAIILFAEPLCSLLGAEKGTEVFLRTKDYLIGFVIGAPAFMLAQVMIPFMQLSGNQPRLITAVALMTFGDIVLDVVNVLFVKWGMFGMGLASSLSYYIAIIIGVAYFFSKKCIFKFRISTVRLRSTLALMKHGIPTVINQLSLVLLVFTLNQILLATPDGDNAVAAYSVVSTISNICYSVGSGIGAVALMLAGIFYEEEDRSSLRELVKTMVMYAIVIDAILIIVVWIVAPLLVSLFLSEGYEGTERLATLGVRIFSLSLVSSSLNTAFKYYFQGINRVRLTEIISFLQNFAFIAAFALLFGKLFGVNGVWFAFFCGETLMLICIAFMIFGKARRISLKSDTLTFLPSDFGADENNSLEISVKNISEAVNASEQIRIFCKEHGQTDRLSMFIALCIEEMVCNSFLHGINENDTSEHSVDIRLIHDEERWIIRTRDNCRIFDPKRYMELHSDDDPSKCIGIRLIFSIVKDVRYVNSLGLNNLTLIL